MKVRLIVPFVICIVMTIGYAGSVWGSGVSPNQYANLLSSSSYIQLQRLDEIAGSLYEAAYTNNRQAGFQYVQQLQRIVESGLKHSSGKSEGWSAIGQDANYIEQNLLNGATASGWLMEAARVRLAADALVRPDHALWLQYESVMLDDISRVEKAWKRQTNDGAIAARGAMTSLQEHAERIESAINMLYGSMREAELTERIGYTNRLLEAHANNITNEAMIDRSLEALKESLVRLFEQSGSAQVLPAVAAIPNANPLSWTFLLGALISAVLTYSGWRKYKANPFGVKPLP
jgi:sporulation protein YpjB